MAREGEIIQLLSGEVNVLHAYIIQGECESTTPSLYMTMRLPWTPCLPSLLKKICASPDVQNAHRRVKSSLWGLLFVSRRAFCAVRLCCCCCCCCRGLFSAWNRMVSREHSGGWALQCTAVLVALLCTPTLFHSCSASDNLSLYLSPSLAHTSIVCLTFLSSLSSHCFCPLFVPIFLHTLKAVCNPRVQYRLLYSSLKQCSLSLTSTLT